MKCPFKYPLRSRIDMAAYITDQGGYLSRRRNYPIEFNVAADRTNLEFDDLMGSDQLKEEFIDLDKRPEYVQRKYRELCQEKFDDHDEHLWGWGQEDAARSLAEDCGYTQTWNGTEVRAVWRLEGRGGKHAVLASFMGNNLEGETPESLYEELVGKGDLDAWLWSYEDLLLLYKFVVEMQTMLTPERASVEVTYQATFCFFANIVEPEWSDMEDEVVRTAALLGGGTPEDLEGLVQIEMVKAEAGVNNEGMEQQIAFLRSRGVPIEAIENYVNAGR